MTNPPLLDTLERGPLIREVGEAIAHCRPPQVFGVHGDWGLGKTSILHQVQRREVLVPYGGEDS